MSNWTHVAAVVRVDGLFLDVERLAVQVFGKQCLWGYDTSVWEDQELHPDEYLYMGSEGSLEMSVWVNPNTNSLAAGTISIFGDLRDHDDAGAVVEWFKKCLAKLTPAGKYPAWIRQATITSENGRNGTVNWTYGGE